MTVAHKERLVKERERVTISFAAQVSTIALRGTQVLAIELDNGAAERC